MKRSCVRLLAVNTTLLLAGTASAQEMSGGEGPRTGRFLGDGPRELTIASTVAKRAVAPARRVALPVLDVAPLLAEDALAASFTSQKSDPRVGVMRTFPELRAPSRLRSGAKGVETMPDGSLVWAAEFDAPGALGLRLHVSRCDLPAGATLVVFDAGEPWEAYGPFTDRGPFNERGPIEERGSANAGAFFLPTVFGERARIEIRVPAKSAGRRMRFSVDRLAHRYRDRGESDEPHLAGAKASACNNNVACDASYVQDVGRAVATMEIPTSDGIYLCSGALMQDSDATTSEPYFLTAHHCLSKQSEAADTEFYFDYRAGTCDGSPPLQSTVPRMFGSTLLATSSSSDFTLLRLTGSLPSNRYFCGWNAVRQPEGESIVGVHHPGGQHMRISYGTLLGVDGSYNEVRWFDGVTAGGSSGSPLFNARKQVIGQLYGGASSCAFPTGIDEYGRFDRTYPAISQYLGQGETGTKRDLYDPADDTALAATPLVPDRYGATHGPHSLSDEDIADWFALELIAGERYRFFSSGADDVRAALHAGVGSTVIASDDESAGTHQFSIDFTPVTSGRYSLKVESPTSGAAAQFVLNHRVVPASPASAPPAVSRLRHEVAGETVTLRWRDRARSEAGYYIDVSDNAGAQWTRLTELLANARSFAYDAGPGTHRYRVGAWNASPDVKWRETSARIEDPNQLDAADPGDDSGPGATQLTPATGGTAPDRTLSRADLEDWYRIALVAGETLQFSTTGPTDTSARLYRDAAGASLVAQDDDSGAGTNFRLVFTAPNSGSYWLRVVAFREGDLGSYDLAWRRR